jgi:hypothetical protein
LHRWFAPRRAPPPPRRPEEPRARRPTSAAAAPPKPPLGSYYVAAINRVGTEHFPREFTSGDGRPAHKVAAAPGPRGGLWRPGWLRWAVMCGGLGGGRGG